MKQGLTSVCQFLNKIFAFHRCFSLHDLSFYKKFNDNKYIYLHHNTSLQRITKTKIIYFLGNLWFRRSYRRDWCLRVHLNFFSPAMPVTIFQIFFCRLKPPNSLYCISLNDKWFHKKVEFWNQIWKSVMSVIGGLLWEFISLVICVHRVFDKLLGVLLTPRKDDRPQWRPIVQTKNTHISISSFLFTVYSGYCLLGISCISKFNTKSLY